MNGLSRHFPLCTLTQWCPKSVAEMFPYFVALSQRVNEAEGMDTDADVVTSTTVSRLTDFEQFDDHGCEDDITLREDVDYDVDDGGGGGQDWENSHNPSGASRVNSHLSEARDILGPMPGVKQDAVSRRAGGKSSKMSSPSSIL